MIERLLEHVNGQLKTNPGIDGLIGCNPLNLMRTVQQNHASFMSTIITLNSVELLIRTVPWMYRAYHARGFTYDYFFVELIAWQIAVAECFDQPDQKTEIMSVYKWLAEHHEDLIKLSLTGAAPSFSVRDEADEMRQVFLLLLLEGDSYGCLRLVEQSIRTADDLRHFYLHVIWPAMCAIGQQWEYNRISVAEEHLATAIVGRVMAGLYPMISLCGVTCGKVVVSAGPNEFHEVGARMVADFMEMDGWDVTYLGANVPANVLLDTLRIQKPFILALSIATVFNLGNGQELIRIVKEDPETRDIKLMVGGLAFKDMPHLWKEIGADGYAADAHSATLLSKEWWSERGYA